MFSYLYINVIFIECIYTPLDIKHYITIYISWECRFQNKCKKSSF